MGCFAAPRRVNRSIECDSSLQGLFNAYINEKYEPVTRPRKIIQYNIIVTGNSSIKWTDITHNVPKKFVRELIFKNLTLSRHLLQAFEGCIWRAASNFCLGDMVDIQVPIEQILKLDFKNLIITGKISNARYFLKEFSTIQTTKQFYVSNLECAIYLFHPTSRLTEINIKEDSQELILDFIETFKSEPNKLRGVSVKFSEYLMKNKMVK